MRLGLSLVVFALSACGRDAPRVPVLAAQDRVEGAVDGSITFERGLELSGFAVTPARLEPGQSVSVSWVARGEGALRLALVPPRTAARQEVRYGDQGPPPPDPRVRWTEISADAGAVALALPEPWHAKTAVLWVEARDDGRTVPAVAGPRTASGTGVLTVLPVATRPTRVLATRSDAIATDGVLDEGAWDGESHVLVASIQGERHEGPDSRVMFRWDDEHLHVAAELPDADVWGTYTERDAPIWEEEAFEVFVAADDSKQRYLELQVSPRNIVFDARFPRYRKGEPAWNSAMRWGVVVDGTVDNRDDRDRGWTVELAIPWSDICENTDITCPPGVGMRFRANVFRFERPARGAPVALALSPTRKPDFHEWRNAAEVELGP